MTQFGEATVNQTTLASMFPISYNYIRDNYMSPRTPQPQAVLAPEKVRPLITGPFSLTYTGSLKIADLNTELLFLSRAVSVATQQVAGGIGLMGGPPLLINISFVNVTFDDPVVPLVIQGLNLTGNLSFSGNLTSFGIAHIGYNTIGGNLEFASEITLASLELYSTVVTGSIVLPPGASLVSILVFGNYPQILLSQLENTKIYPVLTSLLYLNSTDGTGPRDVPAGAKGFGAYTLTGLTQSSYPLITTLAVPDPWSVDLATVFPNLMTLYVMGYPTAGAVSVPVTEASRYNMLTFIGAENMTALDLSERAGFLSGGLRIVGCPLLTGVLLRREALVQEPPREYRVLVIERCALIYLRGARGMTRQPTVLRLGDHTTPNLSTTIRTSASTRLLDYILQALPTMGRGSTVTAVPSDYLPNVIVSLAEVVPSLIMYPVMQTVQYIFARSPATVASDPSGGLTTSYTQYSGGANPVVPTGQNLTGASITVSPFGISYTLRITPFVASTLSVPPSTMTAVSGTLKGSLFPSATNKKSVRIAMGVVIVVGVVLIISLLIGIAIVAARRKSKSKINANGTKLRK